MPEDNVVQPPVKRTHEEWLRLFSEKLNDILKDGFPMPVVVQVLDTFLFEMKISLYFQQLEMMERQQQTRIKIPNAVIPTTKFKKNS